MMIPSVRKNYLYRFMYEILTLITPFITAPYISRVLGVSNVGIYSYVSSIMSYFTLFAALGTSTYGARTIAQCRDDQEKSSKMFWEIELLTVITSGICTLIWMGINFVSADYQCYYTALLPTLLATMLDISWYFTGYEKVKCIVGRNAGCKIVGIILLFVFVKKETDLFKYILLNSLILLLGNLSMWLYLPKMLVKVELKTLKLKKHFQETLIYFIPTIATSIYVVLDKTLIGMITRNTYENGYYEQATKIINMLKSIVFIALNSVMGARISYLFAENKIDEIHQRIEKSIDFIFLLAYGAAFGICAIANQFVPIFFGKGYEPVSSLLYFMSPLIIIIGISNCLGNQYYIPAGLRTLSTKFIIIGSCINLVMNLVLIPHWGAYGAVVASIFAELVITILYINNSNNFANWNILIKKSWKRIIAALTMLIILLALRKVLKSSIATILIQITTGSVIYGGTLLILHDELLISLLKDFSSIVLKNKNQRYSDDFYKK